MANEGHIEPIISAPIPPVNHEQARFAPMFLLKKILSALLLPPASPVLLAALGLWIARQRPRLGHGLIALGMVSLWLLSTPWVAHRLLAGLQDTPRITPDQLANAQAIVVLSGGTYHDAPEYRSDTVSEPTLARLRYGARLARSSGLPVAVTGGAPWGGQPEGESMREALATDFGIEARWVESQARDTAENAARLVPELKAAGIGRIALVTHAWHMPRARALFERQGMTVIPAPTAFATETPEAAGRWLPSAAALGASHIAAREWLGRLVAGGS
jgi:uncharacterized SAM-binding protein YcdF (DUF218 family)